MATTLYMLADVDGMRPYNSPRSGANGVWVSNWGGQTWTSTLSTVAGNQSYGRSSNSEDLTGAAPMIPGATLWVSAPLSASVTFGGSFTAYVWTFESSMNANLYPFVTAWIVRPDGTYNSLISRSGLSEMSTTTAEVTFSGTTLGNSMPG